MVEKFGLGLMRGALILLLVWPQVSTTPVKLFSLSKLRKNKNRENIGFFFRLPRWPVAPPLSPTHYDKIVSKSICLHSFLG